MSKIETPSNHVSIQALRFEPQELTTKPAVFHEPEPERPQLQEMLCRLYHLTADDPKNFTLLFRRFCRNETFREIASDPIFRLRGMDENLIRFRFNAMMRRLAQGEPRADPTPVRRSFPRRRRTQQPFDASFSC